MKNKKVIEDELSAEIKSSLNKIKNQVIYFHYYDGYFSLIDKIDFL